jgi:hypothetical protein
MQVTAFVVVVGSATRLTAEAGHSMGWLAPTFRGFEALAAQPFVPPRCPAPPHTHDVAQQQVDAALAVEGVPPRADGEAHKVEVPGGGGSGGR